MSLIYNQYNSNPDNPVFYAGMSCAAVAGPNGNLPFTRADLSELEDVSYFFKDRTSMTDTPIIDLNGKIGLDTVFSGCLQLKNIYCYPRLADSFTIYSALTQNFAEFACSLLNETIKHNPAEPQVITVINNTTKLYLSTSRVYLVNGRYETTGPGEGELFPAVLNRLNWSIA